LIGFYLLDQNQQTTTGTVSQLPTSIQPNNQLGFTQQQPWQNNQLLQSTLVYLVSFSNSS
jgi:hypothetical protein